MSSNTLFYVRQIMNVPKLCTKYGVVFEVFNNKNFRKVEGLGLLMKNKYNWISSTYT